jgi:hypothetical protein
MTTATWSTSPNCNVHMHWQTESKFTTGEHTMNSIFKFAKICSKVIMLVH